VKQDHTSSRVIVIADSLFSMVGSYDSLNWFSTNCIANDVLPRNRHTRQTETGLMQRYSHINPLVKG